MVWNIAAECISVVTLTIIWAYSRAGEALPSLKNKIFQGCFLVTFCAMVSNILSTVMLAYPTQVPPVLTWTVTMIYFAATPLMGLAYCCYTAAVLYERHTGVIKALTWFVVPGMAYLLLELSNPLNKLLFDISADGVYTRGPLIFSTYLVFYLYSLAAIVLVLAKRHWVGPSIRGILAIFPMIAVVVILVQQIFPQIVLSGSAATNALLIIYLFLQNKQISMDYLTKLPNRQEFLNMLEMLRKRRGGDPFTVLVLSLRDFKQINDTFGQQNGDRFLQSIAAYLHTISAPQRLYRFSGDEFAILIEGEEIKADVLIQQLIERMKAPWEASEIHCVIQAVIGVAQYPISADNVEGLVYGLEYAVSHAKTGRGGMVCYCGQDMLSEIQRKTQIKDILKEKMKTNSLTLYYQPIISTDSRRFVLAESLLRIPDSPLGSIYPNEFIPIAEETGMIVEMTYQILEKVCIFINRLEQEGIDIQGVHVNFSAVQFTQPDLVERVLEIVHRNGTPFSKIKIEITESVLAENSHSVVEFAERMHEQGALLGLDDFGTGYSNLASVLDIPLDVIKIDKSMLWSAMDSGRSAIMLKYLTRVFHELGLTVLVEGVETPEQDALSRDCGIDLIQGYLYARPMPEEEAVRLLRLGASVGAI